MLGTLDDYRREREALLRVLQARGLNVIADEMNAVLIRARENLARVCKNLNARLLGPDGPVELTVGESTFRVEYAAVYRRRLVPVGTCLRPVGLPQAEEVASAVLLLHNDPTVFERWQRQDARYV